MAGRKTFKDPDGQLHEFTFVERETEAGISIRAHEIRDGKHRGHEFAVLGQESEEVLLKRLCEKIERALSLRQIKYRREADTWCPTGSSLRGRISYHRSAKAPLIIIDGQELTWEQFGQTMLVYEGFQFGLDFVDITEEV